MAGWVLNAGVVGAGFGGFGLTIGLAGVGVPMGAGLVSTGLGRTEPISGFPSAKAKTDRLRPSAASATVLARMVNSFWLNFSFDKCFLTGS
jgi:hypothetical protein